jgi:UDP-3-O-[3-hydroxymyristoyl] glucosamine N-acyltransferase
MVDARFYSRKGPFTLAEIASLTGASIYENGSSAHANSFSDVAPLDKASTSDITFLDNVKYVENFRASKAGACFIREKFIPQAPLAMQLLISDDPYRAYAKIAQAFYPAAKPNPFISDKSNIAKSASIGKDCTIFPGAFIDEQTIIGDRTVIGPNAIVSYGTTIGSDCNIGGGTTLSHCIIGNRVVLHRNVNIGQDGFGFAMGKDGHVKVPQLGRVVIEDDVEIGSGTCIDRGTGPDTFIGSGSKIDNLVQIGHNVHIGRNAIVVSQVGISGSTRVGDGAVLGGQVGLAGHLRIGAGAKLAAKSGVMSDVPPGASYGGSPAVPIKDWHRQTVTLTKLSHKRRPEDD